MSAALAVSIIVGLSDNSHIANNVVGDAGMYVLSYMAFSLIVGRKISVKEPKDLLLFVFHAMTVNLFINCLMYFTRGFSFWGLTSFNGERYGGGYYTVLIASVVYGFYDFMSEKRIHAGEFYFHVAMALYCSILAQSRTHVLLCFLGCILVLGLRPGKLNLKYLMRFFIVVIVAFVGLIVFLSSDNALVERILSMDIGSETETTASRVYTWIYYWRKICDNPIGSGFGEIIYFINPSLTIAKDTATYYVDNAFACALYKGGFFYGVLYFVPIFATIYKLVKGWKDTKASNYLMYAVIYTMFILATTVLTSQIIHTYAPNIFAWVFAGCVLNKDFNIYQMKCNKGWCRT